MTDLQHLIAEAAALAGGDPCAASHAWEAEGGRSCDQCDDSQPVFRCARCGQYDYGEIDGPGHAHCMTECESRGKR